MNKFNWNIYEEEHRAMLTLGIFEFNIYAGHSGRDLYIDYPWTTDYTEIPVEHLDRAIQKAEREIVYQFSLVNKYL